jgi:hypothetical protein
LNSTNVQDFYNQNVLPALVEALNGTPKGIQAVQDLFGQNRRLALAQAKESAGMMGSSAGTGLYEGLGGVVNRSLAEEGAILAQMQADASNRALTAAGGAASILGGPMAIYGQGFDLGEALRRIYDTGIERNMNQPRGYKPGWLESLIGAGSQVASAAIGGPRMPGQGGTATYMPSPTIPFDYNRRLNFSGGLR